MRVSSLFPALAGLLLVAGPPTASGASGVAEFLRLGLGARAYALGGGLLSVGHDPSALCWNPALMARTPSAAAEIMHSENFSGAAGFDALAWTGPIGHGSGEALGVGILRLSVDDIPVTDRFAFDDFGADGQPGTRDPGEDDGRWEPGEPVQVDPSRVEWRSDAEWALMVGYARAFGPRVSAGVCAKYLRQEVAGRRGEGFGLDVGLRAEVSGVEVAARVSDITSTRMAWDSGARESLPPSLELAVAREVRLGPGLAVRGVFGAASAPGLSGGPVRPWRGGVELRNRDRLFLRAGSSEGRAAFGAGLGVGAFRVDYAVAPFHDLGGTHRVSAVARW
ncbi:MAG: hypothetical protein HZB25_02935 [Candidatus Eisenbacteria bacterium]|nr:hypothetical protein [Candidatus Eisenbacteria bacterium]